MKDSRLGPCRRSATAKALPSPSRSSRESNSPASLSWNPQNFSTHRSCCAGSRRSAGTGASQVPGQQENDDDDQKKPDDPGRSISPAAAVRPRGNRSEKKHDQKNQKDQAHEVPPFHSTFARIAGCVPSNFPTSPRVSSGMVVANRRASGCLPERAHSILPRDGGTHGKPRESGRRRRRRVSARGFA